MQALVAVMRKLLHAVYGMLKHRQPYDGAKLYRLVVDRPAPSSGHCSAEAHELAKKEKALLPQKKKLET